MGRGDGAAVPPHVRVRLPADIPSALRALGIGVGRPVLVLVGGAGGMTSGHLAATVKALQELVPALERWGAAVVDGGTNAGVMRVTGQVRERARAQFPLIGVAAEGTVLLPGGVAAPDAAVLDRRHSHVILVPGDAWGDESPWLSDVASAIAAGQPSLTLVSNGGDLTYDDVEYSLSADRPVVVLAGTGRTADAIANSSAGGGDGGGGGDQRAAVIARSERTTIVPVTDTDNIIAIIESVLAGQNQSPA